MKSNFVYLSFTIKTLSLLKLWPSDDAAVKISKLSQYLAIVVLLYTIFISALDLVYYAYDYDDFSLEYTNENFIIMGSFFAAIYITLCFLSRKHEIKALVSDLKLLERFTPFALIEKTERSFTFHSKAFIIYGALGILCYTGIPVFYYETCNKNRDFHMEKRGVPCGLASTHAVLPVRVDYTPFQQLAIVEEFLACLLGTSMLITFTMLICGVLKHICTHFKYLKVLLHELSSVEDLDLLRRKVKFCAEFHTAIIDYSQRATLAFKNMMLLHLTVTIFMIGVLGFQIILVGGKAYQIPAPMLHLLGWVSLLFEVSYYGQNLIDESSGIADVAYEVLWYQKPVEIQKYVYLILIRSQKPIKLIAVGYEQEMSFATFLKVTKTAYSFFTLLLRLR